LYDDFRSVQELYRQEYAMDQDPKQNLADITRPDYWSERYDTDQAPWDMHGETAVFRALRERQEMPLEPQSRGRATRLWVPGCGYGYDALAFARAGYDVAAVDFSDRPLQVLAREAQNENLRVECVQADVFVLPSSFFGTFDIALEYTCYCAIPPERREEYAQVIANTLVPGGWLIGLFFPTDGRPGGPPFAVEAGEITSVCGRAGLELQRSYIPAESHPARLGKEILMMFRKAGG
jgi:SAM-dependent methyltransferase